jgi:drug/metabolite transporter (DMT)-like permease
MNKGYLYLILAALSYASMGALVRAISVDTGPYLQTFLRLIVSALLTISLVTLRHKPFVLKHRSDYTIMIFMGIVGYGVSLLLYTLAIYHTTIGNTLFLLSSYPILTALLAYLFLKEKITKNLLISLLLVSIALICMFQPSLGTSLLGNMYAVGVGITTAIYIICSRTLSSKGNAPETITLWSVALAVLTAGVATAMFEHINLSLSLPSLLFLIAFGILNFLAYNSINKGFAKVPAGIGTMILMLEPIIGSLLGLVFFAEIPSLLFLLGGGLLVVSVAIATWKTN